MRQIPVLLQKTSSRKKTRTTIAGQLAPIIHEYLSDLVRQGSVRGKYIPRLNVYLDADLNK